VNISRHAARTYQLSDFSLAFSSDTRSSLFPGSLPCTVQVVDTYNPNVGKVRRAVHGLGVVVSWIPVPAYVPGSSSALSPGYPTSVPSSIRSTGLGGSLIFFIPLFLLLVVGWSVPWQLSDGEKTRCGGSKLHSAFGRSTSHDTSTLPLPLPCLATPTRQEMQPQQPTHHHLAVIPGLMP